MSLFPAKVEDAADARAAGRCENCGGLLKGKYEYDHIKPRGLGGDNSLQNCQVRCIRCHVQKTQDDDMPAMRTADRKAKVKKDLLVAPGEPEIGYRFR